MSAPGEVGCLLLAAGRSTRFGAGNKLRAPYRGKPLGLHASDTLAAIPFARHIAIVSEAAQGLFPAPFEALLNPSPEAGMSSSIALGVEALAGTGVRAALIALADMPLVPALHFEALLTRFDPAASIAIVATGVQDVPQVPALFGSEHFAALAALTGDRGARGLFTNATTVLCEPRLLIDFDRPEDFEH